MGVESCANEVSDARTNPDVAHCSGSRRSSGVGRAGRRRAGSSACKKTGRGRDSPDAGRPSGSPGHLRSRHADAPPAGGRLATRFDRRSGEDARKAGGGPHGARGRAGRRPRAATDRPARTAMSAVTTISGSIPARSTSRSMVRSARRCSWIRPTAACPRSPDRRSSATPRADSDRPPIRRRARTTRGSRDRRPTTTPRSDRSPSGAWSGSARRPVRRFFRPTSTTTFTRSCRHPTES